MNQLEDVRQLHRVTRGDPRVVIAILDGPVDLNHPALAAADIRDLSIGGCAPRKVSAAAFHGTHVCSIIFGQGQVDGIAPQCRGIVIPIFRDGDAPDTILPCSQVELAVAIERAVVAGANIINISGGQYSVSGTVHPILKRVIDFAAQAGVLIVSATGNDACRCYHIPSAYSTVLAVGALDRNGNALEASNWGERYRKNGVVALGDNVFGAVPGGTRHGSGTSFATPIVTGVAALLMSCQLNAGQPANGVQVQQAILRSAHRCFEPTESCQRMLAGKLNPNGALNLLLEETELMTNEFENTQNMTTPNSISPSADAQNGDAGQVPMNAAAEAIAATGQMSAQSAAGMQPNAAATVQTTPIQTAPVQTTNFENQSSNGMAASNGTAAGITSSAATQAGINPSDCGCGCSTNGQLVFVIGEIGFDFGSEARRDSIKAHMMAGGFGDVPEDEEKFSKYLAKNPWDAEAVIWTVTLNNVPIYAVKPNGPYAAEAYMKLREILDHNHKGVKKVCNHVSIPGRVVGQVTLLKTGQSVPLIQPEIRGMANWDTESLVAATLSVSEKKDKNMVKSLSKILEKIYHDHQNLGVRPQDRAINYAASNTTELTRIIKSATGSKMFFDNIECEPSEICRPGSECWVIRINFFVPDQAFHSRKMYRFTVDVSDVVPVSLHDMQDWHIR